MRRAATILTSVSLWGLLACGDKSETSGQAAAKGEASAARGQVEPAPKQVEPEPEPVPQPPRWLLVPWNTKLHVAPEQYAPALTLLEPGEAEEAEEQTRGRVLRVVGKADEAGKWWQLESVDRVDEPGIGDPVVEGLGVYELALYVPAGTGIRLGEEVAPEGQAGETEGEPEPTLDKREELQEEINSAGILAALGGPPLQSGEPRPTNHKKEWQVEAGVSVYWPDGSAAGKVRRTHAFVEPGEASEEGPERTCFDIRVGPRIEPITKLCYAKNDVRETEPVTPFAGDALLGESAFGTAMSDEEMAGLLGEIEAMDSYGGLGEVEGVGGMGFGGNARRGGGAAGSAGMGGIGRIGTGGGGGGGSGHGSFGSDPAAKVTIEMPTSSGGDAKRVRRVIRAHAGDIRSCYKKALGDKSGIEGTLTLSFTIESDGSVRAASAKGLDPKLGACIVKSTKRWIFPKSTAGQVSAPLYFSS